MLTPHKHTIQDVDVLNSFSTDSDHIKSETENSNKVTNRNTVNY